MKSNFYEILELNTNAAQHEITTAYDRAKNTYSGDNPAIYTIFSDQEARELLSMIEEAYSILGNKTLRNIYDQRLLGQSKINPEDLTYDSILNASRLVFQDSKVDTKKVSFTRNENLEKEITECAEWTGEMIRKVREYKNITLERLSDTIKVNSFYIKAIEAMTPNNLPAPVFVRGYVLQMAKELGLNSKAVADSYMKNYSKAN